MEAWQMPALLVLALVVPCYGQIQPEFAANLTVYHLNPKSAGAIPLNMDTGDVRGDLYFYLGEFLLPLECANQSAKTRAHFDCDNPERVDPNLVVTKVDMEIDTRTTQYSACNLCNGTDPFTGRPCKTGTYICDCFNHHSQGQCDPTKLGSESIKDHFTPHVSPPKCAAALNQHCASVKSEERQCGICLFLHKKELEAAGCGQYDFFGFCPNPWGHCDETTPSWMCWAENIPRKTGGYWYSSLAEGRCNKTSTTGSCGWQVKSSTTVQNRCLKNKIVARVESYSPSCFKSCGPRNMTGSCWISCFFDALLGPEAAHSASVELGGLSMNELEKAWTNSFLPESQGGCPRVDIPQSWAVSLLPTAIVV